MKKKITFLTLVSAMLCMSSFVFAQDPVPYDDFETVGVYTTSEWIEIDGVDDEACWATAAEQPIAKTLHDWGVDPVPNTWGFAATYKVVRDENYLYFFVKVKDNTYVPYDKDQMTGETNIDNIEFFFFPNPDDKDLVYGSTDARPRGHSQIRLSVGNTENRATGGGYAITNYAVNNAITGYEYTTVRTADGYNVEVVVPLDIVVEDKYMGNLEVGKKILFDINVANCTDYTSNRVIILGWSGDDYHGWRWNAKLGDMVFKGETSSIQENSVSDINYIFNNGLLSLSNVESTKVDIYDIMGRLVKSTVYDGSVIDLSSAASGVYVVSVEGAASFKIIK